LFFNVILMGLSPNHPRLTLTYHPMVFLKYLYKLYIYNLYFLLFFAITYCSIPYYSLRSSSDDIFYSIYRFVSVFHISFKTKRTVSFWQTKWNLKVADHSWLNIHYEPRQSYLPASRYEQATRKMSWRTCCAVLV
jgi:hypothetical protein